MLLADCQIRCRTPGFGNPGRAYSRPRLESRILLRGTVSWRNPRDHTGGGTDCPGGAAADSVLICLLAENFGILRGRCETESDYFLRIKYSANSAVLNFAAKVDGDSISFS